MDEFDVAWFLAQLPGKPFADAQVDEEIVAYALEEARVCPPLVCAQQWCPAAYPFALALQTAIILYAEGEPQNTAAGGTVTPPSGADGNEYVSFVKSDMVGPHKREYHAPVKKSGEGSANTLQGRLAKILEGCKPPKGYGLMGLAGLNPPASNCDGCGSGHADKSDSGRGTRYNRPFLPRG